MSKKNKKKTHKHSTTPVNPKLEQAQLRKMGKNNVYIILGMIIIGLAIAIYRVSLTN